MYVVTCTFITGMQQTVSDIHSIFYWGLPNETLLHISTGLLYISC